MAALHGTRGGAGQRLKFSSDDLPPELNVAERFRAFQDMYAAMVGPDDIARVEDRPFHFRVAQVRFGRVSVAQLAGSVTRLTRGKSQAAAHPRDEMVLGLHLGGAPVQVSQRQREVKLSTGHTALALSREATDIRLLPDTPYQLLRVPRQELLKRMPGAENLVMRPFSGSLAVRYLQRYCELLFMGDDLEGDPLLADHVENTLLDLTTLCLGAEGDTAEIAKLRGLRAARLQAVLAEIRAGFAEPPFSAAHVAAHLGLSERYVQDLLQETGRTFSERVLELRLQKARTMLADRAYDGLKIGDLAYACGFNEVPYFNRCFRRRFGASPTQFRH